MPLPATFEDQPREWRTCTTTSDCMVIDGACCRSWPSNLTHKEDMRKAMVAAGAMKGDCPNRACTHGKPVCEHGYCLVWH